MNGRDAVATDREDIVTLICGDTRIMLSLDDLYEDIGSLTWRWLRVGRDLKIPMDRIYCTASRHSCS